MRHRVITSTLFVLLGLALAACGISTRPGASGGLFPTPSTSSPNTQFPSSDDPADPVELTPITIFATVHSYDGSFTAENASAALLQTTTKAGWQKAAFGGFSARSRADTICNQERPSTLSDLEVHALISISSSDQLLDMPTTFGFPTDAPIFGDLGPRIADNWADLLDGNIKTPLKDSVKNAPAFTHYWTGSASDGRLSSSTCFNWTTRSANAGTEGISTYSNDQWIGDADTSCNNFLKILCIGY